MYTLGPPPRLASPSRRCWLAPPSQDFPVLASGEGHRHMSACMVAQGRSLRRCRSSARRRSCYDNPSGYSRCAARPQQHPTPRKWQLQPLSLRLADTVWRGKGFEGGGGELLTTARNNLALCLKGKGAYEEAEALYRGCIRAIPDPTPNQLAPQGFFFVFLLGKTAFFFWGKQPFSSFLCDTANCVVFSCKFSVCALISSNYCFFSFR